MQSGRELRPSPAWWRAGSTLLRRGHPGHRPGSPSARRAAPPLCPRQCQTADAPEPGAPLINGKSRVGLERTSNLAFAWPGQAVNGCAGHNRPSYRAAVSSAKAHGGGRIIVLDQGLLDAFQSDFNRERASSLSADLGLRV